jgi:hypothetical protein
MAIRAHWAQMIKGIYLVFLPDFGNRDNMMYVNESLSDVAVAFLKRKSTHLAPSAMMPETFFPCFRIALVCRD